MSRATWGDWTASARVLTAVVGATNAGAILLQSFSPGKGSFLGIQDTLVNLPTGVVAANAGAGRHPGGTDQRGASRGGRRQPHPDHRQLRRRGRPDHRTGHVVQRDAVGDCFSLRADDAGAARQLHLADGQPGEHDAVGAERRHAEPGRRRHQRRRHPPGKHRRRRDAIDAGRRRFLGEHRAASRRPAARAAG